jgi:quinol monooxygenase YgiN
MATTQTESHLTVFVTFRILPDRIEAWKDAHRPIWTQLAAECKCIYFEVFCDMSVKGRYKLVEVWDATKDWFENVQLKKQYYDDLWRRSKPTWEKEYEIEYFERLGEGTSWKKGFLEPQA